MKTKVLGVIFLLIFNLSTTFAQGYEGKGDVMMNLGIGIWGNRGGYFNYLEDKILLPQIIWSLEFGLHDYITLGPYAGFQHRSFRGWGNVDGLGHRQWRVRETWWNVGVKTCFHFTNFLNDKANTNIPEELDLYAGLFTGLGIYHKNRVDEFRNIEYPSNSVYPAVGFLAAGARYFVTPKFGFFLEITPWWEGDLNTIGTGFTFNF